MGTELLVANLTAHWIQAGVLSMVTLAAFRLLRVKDPRLTLAALHVVLALIVLLPWMQSWQTRELRAAPGLVTSSAVATMTVDVSVPLATPAPQLPAKRPIEPSTIALSVIAAGIALRFAWLLLGFIRLRRFAQETRGIPPPEFADEAQARVGAAAQYLEHPTSGSPSTFGIFRPRVVLPARSDSLAAAHQHGALLHELIHVRRRDVAAAFTEEILVALLWFHPWIWIIRRRILVAREQVVDLHVLALTGDRAEYVRCLIEISGHDLVPHLSHAGTAMVRSNELRARVDAIFQEVRMSRSRFVAVSAVLAAVAGTAAWVAVTQAPLHAMPRQTAQTPQTAQTALVPRAEEPLAATQRAGTFIKTVLQTHQSVKGQSPHEAVVGFNGKPVTMDFKDADVRQVLEGFANIGGLNLVLDPKVEGRVTLSLKQVPWDRALDMILLTNGLNYEVDGSVLRIAPMTGSLAEERLRQPAQQASQPTAASGQMRRLIKVAYSDYPSEALDKQISGSVKITIVVNAAGDVTVADVTSGPPELRSSAFKAAMGLKYSPGADTVRINIAVEYRLDPQGWGVRVIQDSGTTLASSFGLPGPAPTLGGPIRVGGNVQPPKKTKDAPPVYPPEAKEAGVQGVVIMEATLDEAGNVSDVKVLRSIPLLDQAAIDAVKQWQYTPTLLNGVAIPVLMTVTVNFTLRVDPTVTLKITLPTGNTVAIGVMDQAGVGTVEMPNVGKFGFTPIRGASPTGRTIAVYQITEPGSPLKLLGNVQVELNGGMVQSPTTPAFGVELVRLPQ